MQKRILLCAVAAVLPGVFLSAASAQVPGAQACKPEAQKYCSAAIGGGRDKTIDCLIEHQQEISDACYSYLKAELERERDERRTQRDAQPEPQPAPQSVIYKVRNADGRIVYTNAPPANAVSAEEVAQDRVINVMPIRSSPR